MTPAKRHFLAGVYVASSYLSISKMDKTESMRSSSISLLMALETILNEQNTTAFSKKSAELKDRVKSGLYSGSDLMSQVLELSTAIKEVATEVRNAIHMYVSRI